MIPFDFDYYRPNSLQDAGMLFQTLRKEEKKPKFFSGGTEIITLGRLMLEHTDAVIDIKSIPECRVMEFAEDHLVLGAALSLTEIEAANPFPLLTKTASEVADHTARNKITLGGNICGRIFYREAVLPFLLSDSHAVIAGRQGYKVVPINEVFQQQLQLDEGEFLVQMITEKQYLSAPSVSIKRRRQWNTGYPLVTVAAMQAENGIRLAFSGICPFPFRSEEMEREINKSGASPLERVEKAVAMLPGPILNDSEGSADYRIFVVRNTLLDIIDYLESAGGLE
ncbi:FAD binding domain-containing protein [Bacillus sp. FJAT-27251]|uniref:FAD binding domain-containing protein n=1 Tax=Bacillus sp. FJAT-27251 TaxID=1684142 RepID=UPI0006A7B4FE|nr:FAD binding domain-containing protein [Bacillus sp. FJAT-27251]